MAAAQANELFNCSCDEFFKIVTDYNHYPEFLQEVKECRVLKSESNRKLVEYTVSVMKSFKYTLWMTEQAPGEGKPGMVTWEFASGDLFKTSVGSWKLVDEGGKTRGTYTVDATFNMLVPSPIANALVKVNLPNMMSSYHKRVANLYGR
jgi:ribosome-associated toxin RatA of RatAB toxin-antitoxin module